ncbi:cyclase family protein [Chloroflexota bacterium]
MKLVDLTRPFVAGGMHPKPQMDIEMTAVRTIEKDGMNILRICFGNHIGTHLDGPKHIIPGGKSLDELPLESFYGTGVVLDLRRGPNEAITARDLESAKPTIEKGDVVLLNTGWSAKFGTTDYRQNHPYLGVDAAAWLVEKNVRMVGIDTTSLDLPHSLRKEGFTHGALRTLLENSIPAIHNLTNLEAVVGKRAIIMALPIKFSGSDGSPARVVAQVD